LRSYLICIHPRCYLLEQVLWVQVSSPWMHLASTSSTFTEDSVVIIISSSTFYFQFKISILNYCVPIFYFFFPFGSLNSASAFLSFIILFNFNTIAWIWWLICLTWSNHFYLFFLVLIYVIFLLVVILLGLIYVQLNACSFVLICIDWEIDTGTRKKIINFCWSYKHSN
jgi:hypothetical protein